MHHQILHVSNGEKKPMPLVERHRPQTLNDIIGQDNVVAVLKGFVKKKCLPNLMFSGDSGVGKTSSAFAFIKDFYAEFGICDWQNLVLPINASEGNGIETIRNLIAPFAMSSFRVNANEKHCVPKIIVLDEADAMTKVAQWALGPIIDETSKNVRFIFIVNYQRKMQDDLQSRCSVLRFPPLSRTSVKKLISQVCEKEKIAFEPEAAAAIGVVAQSDMRMSLNILSSCVLQKKQEDATPLTEDFVYNAAGRVPPEVTQQLLRALLSENQTLKQTCITLCKHLEKNSISLSQVLCDIHELCLSLAAENQSLDSNKKINDDKLKQQFQKEAFVMAVFEQIDETEQHLLAITDAARMMVQTRAFACAMWSIRAKHSC